MHTTRRFNNTRDMVRDADMYDSESGAEPLLDRHGMHDFSQDMPNDRNNGGGQARRRRLVVANDGMMIATRETDSHITPPLLLHVGVMVVVGLKSAPPQPDNVTAI